ncbi:kinase-like domain-containing protein [Pholiota molesta]|nr:kinase-like domain-containing protein [Pholiota molesta]
MATWTPNEGQGGEWSFYSPLSPTISDSSYAPGTLRLEIDESAAEPFSTKFADLFDDLGFHIDAENTATATPDHNTIYDIENFSDMKDLVPGWRYPENEEIVVLSSKRRAPRGLPTILEDHGESRCSITPIAALSDFEFEFDAFDRLSRSGTTANATVCIRRDNGNKYIIKRKRAARNAMWPEQSILETLTNIEATFVSKLCWSFHSGEHIYIVTDCLPENNLMDLIREYGPLGTQHATFYASELAVAISSLHDAGIIHRDIEPRNIKLDTQGHIMLVNFGRAEFTGEATAGTQRAAIPPDLDCVSTVCHAPEFLLGWNHDAAVDCWSFGMLLYYMVFGMHPFGGRQGAEDDYAWVYDQIIRSEIPTESLRLVHPMARDLILKCLERNPAMRWDMEQIKSHPYFISVDWKKVSSMQIEVPTLRKAPTMSPKAFSPEMPGDHRRHSSSSLPFVSHDAPRRTPTHQRAQSVHKSSTHTSESHRDDTSSFSRLFAPLARVEAPALPNLFNPLSRAMDVLQEDEQLSITEVNGHGPEIVCERRSVDAHRDNRASQFWDDLDKEAETSAVSINSLEFGTTTGLPYYKAPKLRKYRSAIQSRSRLFNVSTASFQSKLQRKPRSTGALRQPRPVEVIENLPLGIHQIGSGIGFKYSLPAAVPSKVSISSFAPSCHLFQRGFSALNLGLTLGGSPKAKAKPMSPSASRSPLNATATISPQADQVQEIGNGTFIREMCQSPSWILSPPDSLPSPLALVNSPASSGSEPLSPATLVDAIEDEDYHVNITIPKNLELELDFPLSTWAPTSTLRLVPQSPSASKLPCLDSGDTSISICTDTTG